MYYFVNKDKYCQIWTCLVWFYFTVLVFVHFCNEIEKFQLYTSLKYLVFYGQWKIMSDLNMSHGKMSDFVLFPLFGFTLVIKLTNSDFESHWNTLIYFNKKYMCDFVKFPLLGFTFFSTVGTFSLRMWILSKNNLKHLSMKF